MTEFRYDPQHFADVASTTLATDVLGFLTDHDNLIRMESASELRRPALEIMAPRLVEKFGDPIRDDRIKRWIGHLTRQIMEWRGFYLKRPGVPVRLGGLFGKASLYVRRPDS